MGTTSTTVTANWTVVSDASVVGDDVTVAGVSDGEAWSDVDLMTAIPPGATITNVTFTLTEQVDGTRANPIIPIGGDMFFVDKAQYLADDFGLGYALFGVGGPGDLPDDSDPHTITYDNSVYPGQSGGGGVFDMATFAAALSDVSTPVVLRVQEAQNASSGTSITYAAPLTITFTWTKAGATVIPWQRLTNRDELRLTGRRSTQGSSRVTGYL